MGGRELPGGVARREGSSPGGSTPIERRRNGLFESKTNYILYNKYCVQGIPVREMRHPLEQSAEVRTLQVS